MENAVEYGMIIEGHKIRYEEWGKVDNIVFPQILNCRYLNTFMQVKMFFVFLLNTFPLKYIDHVY